MMKINKTVKVPGTQKSINMTGFIPIEEYLDSLKNDITKLDLSNQCLTNIPSLRRFTKLRTLNLDGNPFLKNLPLIPPTIKHISIPKHMDGSEIVNAMYDGDGWIIN